MPPWFELAWILTANQTLIFCPCIYRVYTMHSYVQAGTVNHKLVASLKSSRFITTRFPFIFGDVGVETVMS